MENRDFDTLTRSLSAAPSRRVLGRALTGLALGLTGLRAEEASAASVPATPVAEEGEFSPCARRRGGA